MKKIYLLAGAALISAATYAQSTQLGQGVIKGTKAFHRTVSGERLACPDTAGAGLISYSGGTSYEFAPEYAPTGQSLIFGYTGGGYVYGNNKSTLLKTVAQGYLNINGSTLHITDLMVVFVAKERDGAGGSASKVQFKMYDMVANRACNENAGAVNTTTLNFIGPATTVKATVDLLWDDIDTALYNVIPVPSQPTFTGDFAIAMETAMLTAGDTVGLLCDDIGSAQNLDYAYHYVGGSYNKWMVTDNIFSATGTGDTDNDIAIFPIICTGAGTGITEFFNGMKLNAYPNPAVNKTTIEYALQKDAKDVSLTIFDQTGRKVFDQKYNDQTAGTYKVNLETINMASGVYYYQLRSNGNVVTSKFAVTK